MSRPLADLLVHRLRFPRVSGDEPWSVKIEAEEVEFSPRERG